MTRDPNDPETPEGTDTSGPAAADPASNPEDDAAPDNVIAFPGPRVRLVAEAEPAAPKEATPQPEATEPSEMTLDAFERAVRSAVKEKLGDPGSVPGGADELVAQVFSALTGKDAKTALAEVRQRLADPEGGETSTQGNDVVDLGAVREARQKASNETAQKIGGALKDTFAGFLATIAQRPGASGEVTLDANFFKQHGPALLGNLFQGLAGALMAQARPQGSAPEAPLAPVQPLHPDQTPPPSTGEASADAAGPAPDAKPVQVRLDLGSILGGLFRRFTAPATPPTPNPPEGGEPN
jgi:hypothetical protein